MARRKSGHVTLTDVAQAAGFAVSTVSIVLSEAPLSEKVSDATREHIREIAGRLGYYPDAHARSLQRQSSGMIGVLAFDLSDPFCVPVVRGVQTSLQETEYLPLIMDAQTERRLFDHHLTMLLERRVEGVIVIASWVLDETNLLADIRKNAVPILIVGRDLSRRGIPSCLLDNVAGGSMAMRHVAELGHRRIAVVRGPREMFDSAPRWTGMVQTAAEFGIVLDPNLVIQPAGGRDSEHGFHSGCDAARQLMASRRPFSAVLAFDDMTALGVVRGLSEAGRRVPEDCSVVGFDDVLPARVATPALTTIRQPLHAMGQWAAQKMVDSHLRGPTGAERVTAHKAPPELIVRSSTAHWHATARKTGRRT